MSVYRNSREHLLDRLRQIDLLLNIQVARHRCDPLHAKFDEFRGVFISEEEVDYILSGRQRVWKADRVEGTEIQRLLSAIEQIEQEIATKVERALEQDVHLRLVQLARMFHLTEYDTKALLICAAPELDLKYEKLYAYLQNDVARKRPTVDLILNLLCDSLEQKLESRERFISEAPLIKYHLITGPSNHPNEQANWLSHSLKIDDRILNYLLDIDTMDEQLTDFARLVVPQVKLEDLLLPADFKREIARLFNSQVCLSNVADYTRVFLFRGPSGVGRKSTAEALCQSADLKLLIADLPQMLSTGKIETSLPRLFREAKLQSAAVYLDAAEFLVEEDQKLTHVRRTLFRTLERSTGIAFIGSQQPLDSYPQTERFLRVDFPKPDHEWRKRYWQKFLMCGGYRVSKEVDISDLANKFNLTAGKTLDAIVEADHISVRRDQEVAEISEDDLYKACRAQSTANLKMLAKKIKPLYRWKDIVLPADRKNQLREICDHVTYRHKVFSEWDFDQKMSLGKGLGALFVGESGTGKTMAAEIIADELSLDLYKIDLSAVVSKYIGETEKNLSKIFEEAEQSNAILFFDEADAIFGKRSEVKDSHDRYANIEINYLLQRMEEYEGITILASNFRRNIDEAFTRRMRFIVEFPVPDEKSRYRIWQNVFPEKVPLKEDIDRDFLARNLKLTGGNIKSIALHASFLAASEATIPKKVSMKHIILATKREFQKMGKLCVKTDFEQYFDWIQEEEIQKQEMTSSLHQQSERSSRV